MSPNLNKLFTALSFLRKKSKNIRPYQWWYPLFLCALAQISYWYLPIKPVILGENGLVEIVNSLLNTLIGFYIASLAAIASFPSTALDQKVKGTGGATLTTMRKGKIHKETLTRRRFLTILFGYCAFSSIFLYAMGQVTSIIAPSLVQAEFFIAWGNIIKFIWLTIYFFFTGSLLITTLLGLHYLIDRMHRE